MKQFDVLNLLQSNIIFHDKITILLGLEIGVNVDDVATGGGDTTGTETIEAGVVTTEALGGKVITGEVMLGGFPGITLPFFNPGPPFHLEVTVSIKSFISMSNLICSLHF